MICWGGRCVGLEGGGGCVGESRSRPSLGNISHHSCGDRLTHIDPLLPSGDRVSLFRSDLFISELEQLHIIHTHLWLSTRDRDDFFGAITSY